ncbi:MAG: STAS domain-containing protein [Ruminococcus sp.]|nr:STAS domain-containing protein [Ruminococcus sp.]
MKINTLKDNEKIIIAVEGRIDSTTSSEFEATIKNETKQVKELVFDFKDLDYISSAGLRILLGTQKLMNNKGNMKIINVNETVNEIFEVTGFSYILDIKSA